MKIFLVEVTWARHTPALLSVTASEESSRETLRGDSSVYSGRDQPGAPEESALNAAMEVVHRQCPEDHWTDLPMKQTVGDQIYCRETQTWQGHSSVSLGKFKEDLCRVAGPWPSPLWQIF